MFNVPSEYRLQAQLQFLSVLRIGTLKLATVKQICEETNLSKFAP